MSLHLQDKKCLCNLYLSEKDLLQNSQLCNDILWSLRKCLSSSSLHSLVYVHNGHPNTVTVAVNTVGFGSGVEDTSFGGRPLFRLSVGGVSTLQCEQKWKYRFFKPLWSLCINYKDQLGCLLQNTLIYWILGSPVFFFPFTGFLGYRHNFLKGEHEW